MNPPLGGPRPSLTREKRLTELATKEKMFVSLIESGRSEKLKKHLQIAGEDEYQCSSEALNGINNTDIPVTYHGISYSYKTGEI